MAVIAFTSLTLSGADSKWVRLRSADVELLSGAGAASGREMFRRMEQIRHVFETRTQRENLTPLPVRIFVFRSEADFRPFQITDQGVGYYQSGTERDYIAMQVHGSDLYRVVFHEYVHLLLHHAQVNVPVWFNEGTAELYSTAALTDREVRLGDPVPAHLVTLRSGKWLDLPTLLSVDHRSPWYNERDKTSIFYAQSWALVHMLNFSPDYQPAMPKFLSMLFTGEDATRAMQQAFGKSSADVQNDLNTYIARGRFPRTRLATPRLEQLGKVPAEPLSATEADMTLADLLLALRRTDPAEELLLKLARSRPDDPAVEAALGDVAVQKREDARAAEHYERAMKLGSGSARLRYEYAMVLRERNAPSDAVIAALRDAVSRDAHLFDARYLLGYTLLKTGQYAAAVDELRVAGELQPYRAAVWEQLALACHYAGSRDQARTAAQRARKLATSPEAIERAEGMLRVIEAGTEPGMPERPQPASRPADAATASLSRADGLLTQVDCLGRRARLHVAAQGKRLFLLVNDPGSIVLRNAGGVWAEFSCGPVTGTRRVIVEYRPVANASYGTSGEVAAIEFR